jgi:hypothetical protein
VIRLAIRRKSMQKISWLAPKDWIATAAACLCVFARGQRAASQRRLVVISTAANPIVAKRICVSGLARSLYIQF